MSRSHRVEKSWALAAVALLVLLLSGCGSSAATDRAGVVPTCARPGDFRQGAIVPGWRLGAIQFFSATSGVGLTSADVPDCVPSSTRPDRQSAQRIRTVEPVFVAVTDDGGRLWRLTGHAAPAAYGTVATGEQLVAASSSHLWVLDTGRTLETTDGGRRWTPVSITGSAVAVAGADGYLWVLSCALGKPGKVVGLTIRAAACRPELWRGAIGSGAWTRLALPDVIGGVPGDSLEGDLGLRLAVSPDGEVLVDVLPAVSGNGQTGTLLVSADKGLDWRTEPNPSWDGQPCTFDNMLTAASHTFWLLCLGDTVPAAPEDAKVLFRSTDGGATWKAVSVDWTTFEEGVPGTPPSPGAIPLSTPSALVAASRSRLWLVADGLEESNDGGRTWTGASSAAGQVISVLSPERAWLLGSGIGGGIWTTADGERWQEVGQRCRLTERPVDTTPGGSFVTRCAPANI